MKRQFRWCVSVSLAIFASLFTIASASAADSTPSARSAAARDVAEALRAELDGKNSHRQAKLDDALQAAPDLAAAHWHNGDVWLDRHWVKFNDPSVAGKKPRLAAYLQNREKYRNTVEDQLALAKWCKTAGLKDEWRAHLGNVLALNPDHAEARAALGYQLVDGVWLTPKEIDQGKSRASAAVAALNKWKPKLTAIRDALTSSNPTRHELARKKLAAIQDSAAIPALEVVFCSDTEPIAWVGLTHFGEMSVADASLALARQALFSKWPAVRKAAVEKLKHRDRDTYVPALLATMHSPTQSRIELFQEPGGRLLYRHLFYQPGHERDELAVFDTIYDLNATTAPYVSSVSGKAVTGYVGLPTYTSTGLGQQKLRTANVQYVPVNRAATAAAEANAAAQAQTEAAIRVAAAAQAREMAAAEQNRRTVALDLAISQLLNDVTGVVGPQSPEEWSEWWAVTDEVYVPGYKSLDTSYSQTEEALAPRIVPVPNREVVTQGPTLVISFTHCSCLAAGTPVWTDAGPVAVEKIKVGDSVLAQDSETGELAYRPVMHTTVRLKADLVKLDLRDEMITCSVGHRFWISGKGWMKAHDIEPGMNFHGVEGTTPLRKSESAGVGAVYNLIVADFHSYFVGKAMIYSHDITARKPTDLAVPGLARQ
jgi:hypothetical protein